MADTSGQKAESPGDLDELQRRLAVLQSLIDNTSDLLAIVNIDGVIKFTNSAVKKYLGYEPEELIGKNYKELIYPEDISITRKVFEAFIKNGVRDTNVELRVLHKNGEWRWLAVSGNFLVGKDDPAQVVLSLRDITDKKRIEETLQKRMEELAALRAVALDVSVKQDWLTLLNTIVERARTLIHAPSGFIYLYDEATAELVLTVDQSYVKTPGIRLKMGEGMAGWVAQHRQPLILDDYSQWDKRSVLYDETPFHACVEVPMIYGGQLIGVLGANESDEIPRKFDEADQQILSMFATQAASIVHDARLFQSLEHELDERKKTEASFRASEERFRNSFNNAPIGMALVDPQERFMQVNHILCEILGYTADELLTKSVPDVTHPDDLQVEAIYKHSVQTGEIKSFYLEKRYLHADGHIVWGRLSVSSIKDANGNLLYYIGQLEDISDQKKLEAIQANVSDLTAQKDLIPLLQTIIERGAQLLNVPSGFIYLYDQARNELILTAERGHSLDVGKRLQLGEGMAGRVALTKQPLIIDDYANWEGRSKQSRALPYRAILEVPMLFNGELVGVLGVNSVKDDTRAFTETEAQLLVTFAGQAASAVNNARQLQTIQTELAERINIEASLRESEARFRSIYENSTIGIYRTTPDGQILLNNPALLNMLGYTSSDELSQRNLTREGFAPGYERSEFQRRIEETGEVRGFESAWQRKDGSSVYVRESARAVRDPSGNTLYYEGTVEDISERKRAELVQAALYQISEASYSTENLENLYPLIHMIVGRLMKAKNLYIALYDRAESMLHFPYFVDEYDTAPQPRKVLGNGLTEYVLISGKPLLAKPEVYRDLEQTGKVIGAGADSIDWLGVPLKTQNGQTIGVLVVQSYSESDRYGDAEKDLLTFVSAQVAMAIERKQIEVALRENEKRLTHAQTIAQVGNWEIDLATRKMWASEEAFNIYGLEYKSSGIPLEVAQSAPLPEYRPMLDKALQDLITNQADYDVEFQIKRLVDGDIRTIHSKAELVCTPEGKPLKIQGVIQDITTSKQAEAALKRSENFSRSIIENEPECVKIVNPDGTLRYMNPAGLAMIEVDDLDLVKDKPIYPIITAEHRPAFIDLTNRVLNGEQGALQFEIIGMKGSRRWLDTHAVPLYDERGRVEALLGLTRDITERKKAEADLHAANEKLAATLDALPDLLFEVDRQGIIYDFRAPNMERLYVPPNEFLGKTVRAVLPQTAADQIEHALIEAAATGTHRGTIYPLDMPAGTFWFELSIASKGNHLASDAHFICLVRNITERIEAEAAMRRSSQLFHAIFDKSPIGISLKESKTGKFLEANQKYSEITQYTPEELLTKTYFDITHPDDIEKDDYYMAKLRRGEISFFTLEKRIIRKDGAITWISLTVVPLTMEGNTLTSHLSLVEDITERKNAEASQHKRRELLEKVLECGKIITQINNLNDCLIRIHKSIHTVLGFDRVGIFLYDANTRTLSGAYGTSITGEIQDTSWFVKSPDEHAGWKAVLSDPQNLTVVEDYQQEHPELPEDHEMRNVHQHVTFSAWAGEVPVAVLTVDNVITQKKITAEEIEALQLFAGYIGLAIQNARLNTELEQRVIERTLQLEETNKELESFSYSVSHDLRAPLRAISSYARIFQEDFGTTLPPDASTVFDNIRISAQNMNNLIEALLKFSRLGRQALSKKPISPSDLVQQALETLSHEQEGRQIELVIGELPPCQGDPALLLQVWVNLLSNAFKYTRQRPVAHIEIGCQINEAKQRTYFVRDNGIGFDMRFADKLFRVFQRLHGVDEFEGTGVGLALVHRIITRHGGRIWAESERNVGTTFFFTL